MSCDTVQERLDERALDRSLGADDAEAAELRAHAAACEACGGHLSFLRALDAELAVSAPAPAVAPSVVAAAQQRAVRALRARQLPVEFGRELVAVLAVAVLGLPLVVAQAFVVIESGAWLLSSWLPEPLLVWLGVGYLGSLALAVGALYGSIPLVVAWRRRAHEEWA